ncbi:hypothetical protein ACOMHN_028238 [Nucella lapillus]
MNVIRARTPSRTSSKTSSRKPSRTSSRKPSRTSFLVIVLFLLHHPTISANVFIQPSNTGTSQITGNRGGIQNGGAQTLSGRPKQTTTACLTSLLEGRGPLAPREVMMVVVVVVVVMVVVVVGGGGGGGDGGGGVGEGRRKRQVGGPPGPDPLDVLKLVCHDLQDLVPTCQLVPPATSNSNWISFFTPLTTPSSPSSSIFQPQPLANPWVRENVTCLQQTDQLSSNSTTYPAVAIAAELAGSHVLFNCLAPTVVLTNTPPEMKTDDFMKKSNATCPFQQRRLFSYFSVNANTTCFFLQNFQETLLFTQCLNSAGVNCQQQEQRDPFWDLSSFNWWSPSPQNLTRNVNRCVTDYGRSSMWSFCPSNAVGSRIIRDRVIVPQTCSSFSMPCQVLRTSTW